MKIVVTGGAGRLGHLTIEELLDHSHEVLSIDKVPISESVCRGSVIDLLRAEDLAQAFEGADAVRSEEHTSELQSPLTSRMPASA